MPVWVNVPNILTMIRLVMVCFMPYLFSGHHYTVALIVFIAAFVTDFLDGYIARKKNLITSFGKLMDPLADKLMLIVTLLMFSIQKRLPWLVFFLVLGKELCMIIGGFLLYRKKTVVYSNFLGKAATGCFTAAVILTFFYDKVYPFNLILMYIAFAISFSAMISYFISFILKKGHPRG